MTDGPAATAPGTDRATRLRGLFRAARLRCPRCGDGPLFRGWFRMHESCPRCGFSYAREPGFYLGSIYFNYGATVILTGGLYALLVLGMGLSTETALAACLAAVSARSTGRNLPARPRLPCR